MTIFAVLTATKMTFAMKIAILTILTSLVGSMRNPMTPHNHVLAMAGCDKWPGSSFSPILDNCHQIYPLKSEFFSWKRLFWPFCPFWWPPCATPWPHSTFFCNGQYWQVFLCRIPLRYWKSFHFFHFFSFMNMRCHEFPDFGHLRSFTAPLWVPPHNVCLFLWQTH